MSVLASLYDSPLAHFVIDEAGRIVLWNRSCQELTGLEEQQVLGSDAHRSIFRNKPQVPADLILERLAEKAEDYSPGSLVLEALLEIEAESPRLVHCTAGIWFRDGKPAGAVQVMERGLGQQTTGDEYIRFAARDRYRLGDLLGKSTAMRAIYERIISAAPSDLSVLITGESGTGKEVVARTIHSLSPRANEPFVAVNCGAIPSELMESEFFGYKKGAFTGAFADKEGLLDKANGGTLFLDEVGELPLHMQVKLLRFLDSKTFTPIGSTKQRSSDLRVIAATNRNLRESINNGQLREDFYFRLYIIPIELPPLRDRKEDIPLFVDEFLRQSSTPGSKCSIPPHLNDAIMRYDWPGNVRELQNTLQRYMAIGVLELHDDTPASALSQATTSGDLRALQRAYEKQLMQRALEMAGGNRAEAARLLGLPLRTFYRKLAALDAETLECQN